jgi:hypothetical protein
MEQDYCLVAKFASIVRSTLEARKSKSPPLKKGDLGGFSDVYKIPPNPPLEKGGIKKRLPLPSRT